MQKFWLPQSLKRSAMATVKTVRTGGVGAAPPARGSTPAPRPNSRFNCYNQFALLGWLTLVGCPLPGMAQIPSQPVAPLRTTPLPPSGIAQPLPPQNVVQPETGYLLGAGDRVRLDFFNVPEYTGEYLVLADGTLNLPSIGAVPVGGLTLKQASSELAVRYKRLLKRPIVTISLLTSRPLKIAVAGEVTNPGTYTVSITSTPSLAPTSTTSSPSLIEGSGIPTVTRLLQLAGGPTQSANIQQIQVRRRQPGSSGAVQVINLNLQKLLREGDISQDLQLRDGDSIFIPTATSLNLDETAELAAASFAPSSVKAINVAVVGQVNRPGPYTLQPTSTLQNSTTQTSVTQTGIQSRVLTVSQAIQAAGGITQSADISKIQVRRLNKTGAPPQTVAINFRALLLSGDLRQDIPLQEGDTVLIPIATILDSSEATTLATASFSPDKITVNVVGEVKRPGAVQVPPNTPLNQALLAAGGFNARATRGSVELVRLNPNGSVTRRKVDIDFSQGANEANNPTMRNNDTIVIRRTALSGIADTVGIFLSPVTGFFSLFNLLGL